MQIFHMMLTVTDISSNDSQFEIACLQSAAMRIKISLMPLDDPASLPLDHYPLAALIYRSVSKVAPEYAAFLHEQGYQQDAANARAAFKFFVFSKPYLPDTLLDKGRDEHVWFRGGRVTWQVASPEEGFIAAFVNGLVAQQVITIGDKQSVTRFMVTQVEEILPPVFSGKMRFTTLSPLTVSVSEPGNKEKQYLRADDPRFGSQVCNNLCHKFRIWTGEGCEVDALRFEFDWQYIERRGGVQRVSRLESYKGTKIKSWQAPFIVTAPPELLQLGWECGFGEGNSKGFGMVQASDSHSITNVIYSIR